MELKNKTIMKSVRTIPLAAFFLLISTIAVSQPKESTKTPEKDKKMEQLQSAKVAFFTAQLELTTEEAEKFWPVYNKYWEARSKEHRNGRAIFRKIKEASSGKSVSDVELKSLMLEWQNHCQKELDLEILYRDEFYKILPVRKVLKIYVAEEDFRVKMINMWKKPKHND